MHRVLKPTGSLYLHCDPAANSYLRLLLDAVFGRVNFRNEIVWGYPASPSATKRDFPRKHDTMFRYSKGRQWTFNADAVRVPYSQASMTRIKYGAKASTVMSGTEIKLQAGGKIPPSVWTDVQQSYRYRSERTGWPTQKPLALYRRIIEASSNPGDLVLDPFAGCATTCIAAETASTGARRWIGIDIDPVAEKITLDRLRHETGLFDTDGDPVTVRKRPPKRNDIAAMSDDEMRQRLHSRQGARCANWHCDSESLRMVDMDLDHVIPKTRGGADGIENRIGLCGNCNRRKGTRAWGEFMAREAAKAAKARARLAA